MEEVGVWIWGDKGRMFRVDGGVGDEVREDVVVYSLLDYFKNVGFYFK